MSFDFKIFNLHFPENNCQQSMADFEYCSYNVYWDRENILRGIAGANALMKKLKEVGLENVAEFKKTQLML